MSGVCARLHRVRPVVVLDLEDGPDVVLLTPTEAEALAAQLRDAACHAQWRIGDIARAARPAAAGGAG